MFVGHKKQWAFLETSFKKNNLAHAYLFSGPESIGKKTLAVEFVKLIHCQEKEKDKKPCNICSACRLVSKNTHPDNIFLQNEEGKKEIQISQLRDLIYKLSLKPFTSQYKTAIIDDAHLMNSSSQNCLLKTLEEPKGNCLLILVTSQPELLFKTVLSRIQEIKFFLLPEKEINDFLSSKKVESKKRKEIIDLSLGRIGEAVDFLNYPQKIKKRKKWISLLSSILKMDTGGRFKKTETLSKNFPEEVFAVWIAYLRKIILFKTGNSKEKSSNFEKYSLHEVKRMIEEIETTRFLISTRNINKRLALELLMTKI